MGLIFCMDLRDEISSPSWPGHTTDEEIEAQTGWITSTSSIHLFIGIQLRFFPIHCQKSFLVSFFFVIINDYLRLQQPTINSVSCHFYDLEDVLYHGPCSTLDTQELSVPWNFLDFIHKSVPLKWQLFFRNYFNCYWMV